VFDIACFTCKEIANLVLSLNISLALEDQLGSENEQARRNELEYDFEIASEPMSAYEELVALMDEEFKDRIDAKNAQDFPRRLDKGWNRSQSMLCNHCNKFIPNSEPFWKTKKQTYLYKINNKAAHCYRIIRDCACKCHPDEIIEKWVNREERLRGLGY
jgi:methionyl-tRNA synthetase